MALAQLHIARVVLEATSDYWRPFFYLLEARGLCVWLREGPLASGRRGREAAGRAEDGTGVVREGSEGATGALPGAVAGAGARRSRR